MVELYLGGIDEMPFVIETNPPCLALLSLDCNFEFRMTVVEAQNFALRNEAFHL